MSFVTSLGWLPSPPEDFRAACRAVREEGRDAGRRVQFLASHALDANQAASLGRVIAQAIGAGWDMAPLEAFRLGFVAAGTSDLIGEALPAAAARHGVALEVVAAPYGQIAQQALDPRSEINVAGVNAVLMLIDQRWLQLDRVCPADEAPARIAAALDQLRSAVDNFRAHGGAPVILPTIACAPERLRGGLDRVTPGYPAQLVEEVNRGIVEMARSGACYLLDVAALANRVGLDLWFDPVQYNLYKLPFAGDAVGAFADTVGRLLAAIRGRTRKCLVLDLDNTVWGGVIGDDGLGGIKLGQGSPKGEAFLAVQQMAIDLRSQGVILAVCSKNTDEVARGPFREHPEMLLREQHIQFFQANWEDKPTNLEAIAAGLNIGVDALVLLDDNPAERAHVRAALPMVAAPELPSEPSLYPRYLSAAGYFESVGLSAEDLARADSYSSNAMRAEVMSKARDLGDYLQSLEMEIGFAPFDEIGRARIVQLINKSNQFNLTTRRYTDAEIARVQADPHAFTLQVRLSDRFGDLGMIGVIIARPAEQPDTWELDTWLMSCRVLGRRVEDAMLLELATSAKAAGVRRLIGVYRPTAKNSMVREHYPKLGFAPVGTEAEASLFALDLAGYAPPTLPFRVVRPRAAAPDRETVVEVS